MPSQIYLARLIYRNMETRSYSNSFRYVGLNRKVLLLLRLLGLTECSANDEYRYRVNVSFWYLYCLSLELATDIIFFLSFTVILYLSYRCRAI